MKGGLRGDDGTKVNLFERVCPVIQRDMIVVEFCSQHLRRTVALSNVQRESKD